MKSRETPPFAPTLMESTRAIGYSLEAAIADIIDNSIAAKAGEVKISFFPIGDAYVCILDDGAGMNSDAIDTAMQYGSKSPSEARELSDLGRYGFHGICSSFAFRYIHYTKWEKQKKLCGQAFTQYKYRLRNKETNKYKLRQNMKKQVYRRTITLDIPAFLAYPSVADASKIVILLCYGFIDTRLYAGGFFIAFALAAKRFHQVWGMSAGADHAAESPGQRRKGIKKRIEVLFTGICLLSPCHVFPRHPECQITVLHIGHLFVVE